jgi:hypothetical protein
MSLLSFTLPMELLPSCDKSIADSKLLVFADYRSQAALTATADTANSVISGNVTQSSSQVTSTRAPTMQVPELLTPSVSSNWLTRHAMPHAALSCSELMHAMSNTATAMSNTVCTAASTIAAVTSPSDATAVSVATTAIPLAATVCTVSQQVSVDAIGALMNASDIKANTNVHEVGACDAAHTHNAATVSSTILDKVDAVQAVTPVTPVLMPHTDCANSTDKPCAAVDTAATATARSSNNENYQSSQPTTHDCSTSTDDLHAAAPDTQHKLALRHGVNYIGAVSNGQPHGFGTAYMTNGTIYTGNWLHGTKHGQGTLVTVRGGLIQSTYVGTFCDGIRQGQGQMLLASGHTYNGTWHSCVHYAVDECDSEAENNGGVNCSMEEHTSDEVQLCEQAVYGKHPGNSAQSSSKQDAATESSTEAVVSAGADTVAATAPPVLQKLNNGSSQTLSSATDRKAVKVVPRHINVTTTSSVRRLFVIVQSNHSLVGSLTLDDAALFCRTCQNPTQPVASVVGLQMQSQASVFKYILYISLGAMAKVRPEFGNEFTVKTAAGDVTVLSRHRATIFTETVASLQQLEFLICNSASVQHVSAAVTFCESEFLTLRRSA